VGGGPDTNVPPGSIRNVESALLTFNASNLNALNKSSVEGSVECINLQSTEGGAPPETISEIKANGAAFFAAQNRAVTKDDFIARVLTMPEKFGKPEKVFVKRNNTNALAIDMHVLAKDPNGHLTTATSTLKKNVKKYISQYRMLTDGINILDAKIINMKMDFGVVVSPKFNRSEVLTKCLDVAMDYFDVDRWQIGQPIVISDLSSELQSVLGVVSVYEIKFSTIMGTSDGFTYSNTRFDVKSQTSNSIIYCPDDSIFEIKFPRRDIVGVAK